MVPATRFPSRSYDWMEAWAALSKHFSQALCVYFCFNFNLLLSRAYFCVTLHRIYIANSSGFYIPLCLFTCFSFSITVWTCFTLTYLHSIALIWPSLFYKIYKSVWIQSFGSMILCITLVFCQLFLSFVQRTKRLSLPCVSIPDISRRIDQLVCSPCAANFVEHGLFTSHLEILFTFLHLSMKPGYFIILEVQQVLC